VQLLILPVVYELRPILFNLPIKSVPMRIAPGQKFTGESYAMADILIPLHDLSIGKKKTIP
jgi:hypothetical protein